MTRTKEPAGETPQVDLYRATTGGVVRVAGRKRFYHRGQVVRADDPLRLALPGKFIPVPDALHTAPAERA